VNHRRENSIVEGLAERIVKENVPILLRINSLGALLDILIAGLNIEGN
jgi:ATP-dependent Clp protease ATP-binding subunit ClpA